MTGPRPHVHWVSDIGSSPVAWYAISAEQADALPHAWQKGASTMGGLGGVGLLVGAGRSCFQIEASKLFFLGDFQEHDAGPWDAIALPIAHTWHGETKQAGHLRGAAQALDDFGCCCIHAVNLSAGQSLKQAPANNQFGRLS